MDALRLAIETHQRGHLEDAERMYRQIIDIHPEQPDALHLLGLIAYQRGQIQTSIQYIRRSIELSPQVAEAHNNLGNAFRAVGKLKEAIEAYQNAIALKADYYEARYNLGVTLRQAGMLHEAMQMFRSVVELQPNFGPALNDLGSALRESGALEEAVLVLQELVRKHPRFDKARNNLGNALRESGRLDEAELHLREARRINPNSAEILCNLANVLQDKGAIDESIAASRAAIAIAPDVAESHFSLANTLLLTGDFPQGFREYAWCKRRKNKHTRWADVAQPLWNGSPLKDRTILLHEHSGFGSGDFIQFARFVPIVANGGGKIVFECPSQLHRLLRSLPVNVDLVSTDEPTPPFDVQSPLTHLPLVFHTMIDTIPASVPYLKAAPDLVVKWAHRLGKSTRPRIGLAWAGDPHHPNDRRRSCRLRLMEPLAAGGVFEFHSLQVGSAAGEASNPSAGLKVIDHSHELIDFAETAALMANLDLVISVDTSVAHLAGALAKPVWLMLHSSPEWRWLRDRTDSPWYPTMRLFRQTETGNWNELIDRLSQALGNELR